MIAIITGASSGIGRATALEFARQGATVVVAARFGAALDDLVKECQDLGAQAMAVPIDVSREEEIQGLASRTIEAYGHFDVWVNNAAVSLFGHFEEIPTQDIRRLLDINVLGYMYGAQVALRHFRARKSGHLINVSSMTALVGQPYSVPYSVSKFAVRGLSLSLAQEVADEKDIHVSCVLPSVIDTPIFQHAGNYMGQRIKAPNPVIPAEDVAKTIYKLTQSPKEEVAVGNMARMMRLQRLVLPLRLFDKNIQKMIRKKHFKKEASGPYTGNLYEPQTNWNRVNGGWRPEDSGKGGNRTFKTISGIATLLLVGTVLGTALYENRKAGNSAPAK